MNVKAKIKELRRLMKEKGIDLYYIPNEDDHLSEEFTADYFKCKSYISGFSGEFGSVVVTQNSVKLWTDGRYFTQAENELKGSGITLMRIGLEGVPNVMEYIVDNVPIGGMVGYDGKVVSANTTIYLEKIWNQNLFKYY